MEDRDAGAVGEALGPVEILAIGKTAASIALAGAKSLAGSLAGTVDDVTKQILQRKGLGADGGISRHIIERGADDSVRSVTHQVVRDGRVIHQHQRHIGRYGTERRFPDEWIEYPTIE